MSSTKRRGGGLLFILILIGLAFGFYYTYDWYKDEQEEIKTNIESSFYKPTMINDTTMHYNTTDASCIMIQIQNDTVLISSHNNLTLYYDRGKHELIIVSFNDEVKKMDLDTIFENVPNEVKFINVN